MEEINEPELSRCYAFQPGEEKVVTIREVKSEIVQNQNGKEECTVAHFVEDVKPLILNKTNADAIARVWGTPYIEDWAGKKITLKVKKVSAFGDMVDAVRVAKERPEEETILCEMCGKPILPVSGRTAKEFAAATKAKYGKAICMNCVKEAKQHE